MSQARVIHRDEIGIEKTGSYGRIGRRPLIEDRLSHQPADREAVGHRVAADVQERLRADIAGDDVGEVQDPAGRVSGEALGIAQDEILVGVIVGPDGALDASP